jgi:NDP-sugar pyrophosphorylase family protein
MRAMVLAAGLGTRLRPLTKDRPKALVELGGKTLLEITLMRLASFGVRDVIINVHHFADMVIEYLKAHGNFGLRVEISREDDLLLDTGGGLKKAAWFFLNDPARLDEPFLLHNVDVVSTIDLQRLVEFHGERRALATLAVQQRESSRQLLFDAEDELSGRWISGKDPEFSRPTPNLKAFAFSGIHAVSPRLLPKITEEGAFPIIESYLRLARQGEKILAFRADEYRWRDLGRIEDLRAAEREFV